MRRFAFDVDDVNGRAMESRASDLRLDLCEPDELGHKSDCLAFALCLWCLVLWSRDESFSTRLLSRTRDFPRRI